MICTDKAGANLQTICDVFEEEYLNRMVTCHTPVFLEITAQVI